MNFRTLVKASLMVLLLVWFIQAINGQWTEEDFLEEEKLSEQWKTQLLELHGRDKRAPKVKLTKPVVNSNINQAGSGQKAKVAAVPPQTAVVHNSNNNNNNNGRKPLVSQNNHHMENGSSQAIPAKNANGLSSRPLVAQNNRQVGNESSQVIPAKNEHEHATSAIADGIGCSGACPGTKCLGNKGHCYVYVEKNFRSCHDVDTYCHSVGGRAASFHDESSYAAIKPMFLGHNIWLGIHAGDSVIGSHSNQHFDGSPIDYTGPAGSLSPKVTIAKGSCMYADKQGRWYAAVGGGASGLCRTGSSLNHNHNGTATGRNQISSINDNGTTAGRNHISSLNHNGTSLGRNQISTGPIGNKTAVVGTKTAANANQKSSAPLQSAADSHHAGNIHDVNLSKQHQSPAVPHNSVLTGKTIAPQKPIIKQKSPKGPKG